VHARGIECDRKRSSTGARTWSTRRAWPFTIYLSNALLMFDFAPSGRFARPFSDSSGYWTNSQRGPGWPVLSQGRQRVVGSGGRRHGRKGPRT
jgi:hypothetical protein